ncbi:MAG TPA: hypothetical protein VFW07_01010 [Parafilimonas sp.]|nr:hypothetical protein [Parafilimonas sp.]
MKILRLRSLQLLMAYSKIIQGFSTGALAKGNFYLALELLQGSSANAVELSALREDEVKTLIAVLSDLNLDKYEYISFHAPSKLFLMHERELINLVAPVVKKGWPVIVHPDIISDYGAWRQLNNCLCIENMDKRKPTGRTSADMETIFEKLPEASFCFDIAHAHQVDPTMADAYTMVTKFKHRLREIHISSVNTQSQHEGITFEALLSFRKIADFIPAVPVIIESTVTPDKIETELQLAALSLKKETDKSIIEDFEAVLNY